MWGIEWGMCGVLGSLGTSGGAKYGVILLLDLFGRLMYNVKNKSLLRLLSKKGKYY
jgi:hypothetical protein